MKVCVIGLGTVGTPTIKYFHEKGFQALGYDIAKKSIEGIETYTNWKLVPEPEIYVITVSSENVESICKMISEKDKNCFVSIESTVPVGTCRTIYQSYDLRNLVHCPHRYWREEPMAHGVKQQRVIGAVNKHSLKKGFEFYGALDIPVHVCQTIEIAEMCKVAENAYRFVQIAFAEELRRICEDETIPFEEVRTACNTKWNIQIPEARHGIYGSCLPKDMGYMNNMVKSAPLIEGAIMADEIYKNFIKTSKKSRH